MATEAGLSRHKAPMVEPGMVIPFVLLLLCFTVWGAAANLTDILVAVFRGIFTMNNFQSSLVQFAYYGAYFVLALPAAFINSRFGYKAGLLSGLGLAAVGGMLFLPASWSLTNTMFLVALFTLAAGLSILETSANPFVIAMGSEETATLRLNLAQAFNPIGVNLGVLMGAVLILPHLTPEESKIIMTQEQLVASQRADLTLVLQPYLGIAAALILIAILIAVKKFDIPQQATLTKVGGNTASRLWHNKRYRYGVAAQFFNVAAQTCVWTFTVTYATDVVGVPTEQAGWWLQASVIVFLISRFVMTWLLRLFRPAFLLLVMALFGVGCCVTAVFVLNVVGLVAVVMVSAALSLMFPTIYGVALNGLGEDTKFGSAGLVMAILGGALLPMVHAAAMDHFGSAAGYAVPGACLTVVAAYAVFDLSQPRTAEHDKDTSREVTS